MIQAQRQTPAVRKMATGGGRFGQIISAIAKLIPNSVGSR